MNVEIVDRLIEKDPSLESSRSALEAMKEGASCIHRAWGVGKITGFEADRGMIIVDFEDGERKSHAMDPVFCLDKLEVLDDEHIISRHRANPEEIDIKVKKEPVSYTHLRAHETSLHLPQHHERDCFAPIFRAVGPLG